MELGREASSKGVRRGDLRRKLGQGGGRLYEPRQARGIDNAMQLSAMMERGVDWNRYRCWLGNVGGEESSVDRHDQAR